MKSDPARRLALVALLALLVAAPLARAADAPKAVGTWDVLAQTPNGEMPSVLTIKQVEGQIKAEIEIDGTKRTVSDEKLEANAFSMKVEYDGNLYSIEGKIDGDTLEGTWAGSGYSGTLKAKRRP